MQTQKHSVALSYAAPLYLLKIGASCEKPALCPHFDCHLFEDGLVTPIHHCQRAGKIFWMEPIYSQPTLKIQK